MAVGLDVDLKHLVEFVEQVDKRGAQIGLEGVKDIDQRDLQGLRLGPVDVQVELGAAGAEGGGKAPQAGIANFPSGRVRLRPAGAQPGRGFRGLPPSSGSRPSGPAPGSAAGSRTKACASWIPASSRLMLETILSWSRAGAAFIPVLVNDKGRRNIGDVGAIQNRKAPDG